MEEQKYALPACSRDFVYVVLSYWNFTTEWRLKDSSGPVTQLQQRHQGDSNINKYLQD